MLADGAVEAPGEPVAAAAGRSSMTVDSASSDSSKSRFSWVVTSVTIDAFPTTDARRASVTHSYTAIVPNSSPTRWRGTAPGYGGEERRQDRTPPRAGK